MGFGDQAQNLSFVYNGGTIIQFVFKLDGKTDGGHHVQALGLLQNEAEPFLGAPGEGALQEQVATGVSGKRQLGQTQHLDALVRRLLHQRNDGLGVMDAVGYFDLGRSGGDLDKSVSHRSSSF